MRAIPLLKKYQDFLPINDKTPILSLHEGSTPLIEAKRLSKELGIRLFLKFEGMNPTGSFKDRGMVLAVAKALENGSKKVICASTGNTSAAASAYAASAGIESIVVIPEGNIALGKLAQAMIYGAKVIAIKGNFDEALAIVRKIAEKEDYTLVNSVNPYRIEGQKTAAFEVVDDLGDAPDYLAIPVGNAGNITAYWKGFKEYYQAGKSKQLPKMIGFEAEGAAALVKGEPIPNPETVATAIRIGNPASWKGAMNAVEESGGLIDSVTDEEILAAYLRIAKTEGVFVEPGSAASLAGVIKKQQQGYFEAGATVVSVLTGHGLKDPNIAVKTVQTTPLVVENDYQAVLEAIQSSQVTVL
ncbi:threonine synthase [Tepidibacillus fermentans]|uniref:Threonine synthase n=1 Tax=Tepidibacillus fermentans TaxID=1281767 RepID=A0A4R3K7E4_9BACI|nr:threonine synthase [Tepidibacillus fermentans]TCS78765.1 threonine synthase [Tepidibacillus fermentans]